MNKSIYDFGQSARELSKNPLGIIALFIVLVYGFACLLFGFSAKHLLPDERVILIWFTALFPICVLLAFVWLVSKHPDKLYGPRDFRTDESFLKTLDQKQSIATTTGPETKKEIEDLMKYGEEFGVIKKQEDRIRADLTVRKLDFNNPTAGVLIRHLAASQVLRFFDNTYNTLFGSQIRLLRLLDQSKEGLPENVVQEFFVAIQNANAALSTWDLVGYIKYLMSQGLVDKIDQTFRITKLGEEFLIWLSKSGNNENRAL